MLNVYLKKSLPGLTLLFHIQLNADMNMNEPGLSDALWNPAMIHVPVKGDKLQGITLHSLLTLI